MAQAIKFKYSKNLKAIQSRLRRLPELVNGAMDASVKRDIINTIKEYQDGIENDDFGLEALTSNTVRAKIRKQYPKPRTPLYGKGKSQKNSLINALAFRKIKNGYRLYRRTAKHHEADLPLNILLLIHENGAIIKNGFGKGIYIRIPPRPVVDHAIIRALKKKKKGEPDKSIRKAINQLINEGKDSMFKKLSSFIEREGQFFET